MTARSLRRRHRRAMMKPRRRRFTVERHGVFETPHETVTHHEIPRA